MDKIQRQILKNQVEIMEKLCNDCKYMKKRIEETKDLVTEIPKDSKEPCCEMSEEKEE